MPRVRVPSLPPIRNMPSHELRSMGACNVSYLVRLHVWNTRDVIQKTIRKVCRTPSLLLVVVARVPAVAVLAGQTKCVHFVVSGSDDVPVTRSPIEGAVHNRRAIDYGAPAREVPEDVSVCRVQRVHLS